MGKQAKISVIPKDYSGLGPYTQAKALRDNGYSRFPGTGRIIFPYKEMNGKYRTGLDENDKSLDNIADATIREQEKTRRKELREALEEELGDLSPKSEFWKTHKEAVDGQAKATPFKLVDRDMIFNLDDAHQAATFAWVSVHPAVAPSLEAYSRGEVPADTMFYVNNDNYEASVIYAKKKLKNDAISKLNAMSLERRRKIARLMDLPVSDDTQEETVYNMVDNLLQKPEVPSGVHKGNDPVRIFTMYVNLDDESLDVRDLVEQAFKNNIYRIKRGRVYEGELEVFESREDLTESLLDIKNQKDRLDLERKLKFKKLATA